MLITSPRGLYTLTEIAFADTYDEGLVDKFFNAKILVNCSFVSVVLRFEYYSILEALEKLASRSLQWGKVTEEGGFLARGKLPWLSRRSQARTKSRARSGLEMKIYYQVYIAIRDEHCCLWKAISCSPPSCPNSHSPAAGGSSLQVSSWMGGLQQ